MPLALACPTWPPEVCGASDVVARGHTRRQPCFFVSVRMAHLVEHCSHLVSVPCGWPAADGASLSNWRRCTLPTLHFPWTTGTTLQWMVLLTPKARRNCNVLFVLPAATALWTTLIIAPLLAPRFSLKMRWTRLRYDKVGEPPII